MTDCQICCETSSKNINCQFCEFECCIKCVKRYLLDNTSDPHCMSCKKKWTRDFLDQNLPKTFISKELKKHREEILLDREKSLLPSTQTLVEREIRRRDHQKIINDFYKRRRELVQELKETNNNITDTYRSMHYGNSKSNEEKKEFVRKCPVENCMGYLSTQWKCGICNIHVCSNCHEIKGENRNTEHTCLEANVETAKLVMKETKPCPSCSIRIYKIDGCDQMYCTSCNTPFSWRTGQKVISGVIHNPHYYEFMRNRDNGAMPRQLGDIPCGGLPNIYEVNRTIKTLQLPPRHDTSVTLYQIHRLISHIQYTEMHRYEYEEITGNTNSDLRIRYMLKEISEKDFQMTLQKREKKNQKCLEISQILQMFLDTSSEIFRNIVSQTTIQNIEIEINTLEKLRSYVNENLSVISRRFNCVVPITLDDWIVQTQKY